MSEGYTPSMDRLRSAYVADRFKGWRGIKTPEQKQETNAEFDRAIAAHDAERAKYGSRRHRRHLKEFEAELREQIAQEIEVHMRHHDNAQIGFSAVGDAYAHAARIARGQEQD